MFALGEKGQPAIQAFLHIGGANLGFGPPGAGGLRTAKLYLVAVTEGEDAASGETTQQTYSIRVKEDALDRLRKEGLVYGLQHPVRKPGAYHLRVAVMDELSGKIGSANRFIEVPDVRKGGLAISGIIMREGDWRPREQNPVENPEQDLSPAVRVFHFDQPFSYGVTLYNARLDQKSGQPGVELQARLIRDNRIAWEGKRFSVVYQPGMDPRRIPAGGVLTLGKKTLPGDYLLEIQVTGTGRNAPVVTQWIDFELR